MISARDSLKKSLLPWHHKKVVLGFFQKDLSRLKSFFPQLPESELVWLVHHIYLYDRGVEIENYFHAASHIKDFYPQKFHQRALFLLTQSYIEYDFIWKAHLRGLTGALLTRPFWRLLSWGRPLRLVSLLIAPKKVKPFKEFALSFRNIYKSDSEQQVLSFLDQVEAEIRARSTGTWPKLPSSEYQEKFQLLY